MGSANFVTAVFLLLGAMAGACRGQQAQCGNFSFPTPMENFTMSEIWGKWYEQETYELTSTPILQPYICSRHTYGDTEFWTYPYPYDYDRHDYPDGSGWWMQWQINYMAPDGAWRLHKYGDNIVTDKLQVVNVDTDYTTYAIQFHCLVPFWENPPSISRLVILTREQMPSEALITQLEAKVEAYGFQKEYGVRITQTDCPSK